MILEQALGLCLELDRGHTEAEADCLSGLAALAGLEGDVGRAAQLFGAAEAVREAIGVVPSPRVRPIYERLLPEIAADADERRSQLAGRRADSRAPPRPPAWAFTTRTDPPPEKPRGRGVRITTRPFT